MTPDSAEQSSASTTVPTVALADPSSQVQLKRSGDPSGGDATARLQLILPRADRALANDWSEIWEQLKQRLNTGERFWQSGTWVHLLAQDRLLDGRQLQAIAEALAEVELKIEWVLTSRRQTAVAAAMAGYSVEQQSPEQSLAVPNEPAVETLEPPLYIKSTLRSGAEIRHPGTIVIFGDLNPGSSAIATGDILVLGRLRGIAHAGSQGNRSGTIVALQMEATQLRIADVLARVPESPPGDFYPEIAYITPSGLRLAKVVHFFKTYTFSTEAGAWIDTIASNP
jgi:septum site-determining protein MinC